MLEKRLEAVSPQLLTADGTFDGKITVIDTTLFKVKQEVLLNATGEPTLTLEVKRVLNKNEMLVGPKSSRITETTDVSAYTVAKAATIHTREQKRPTVPFEEIIRAVYEEEPTVAFRTFLVDELGDKYTPDNPLPVQLSDGSISIGTVNAELEVQLTHLDNDPDAGDVHDSVRIGDGTNQVKVEPDGSINANIESDAADGDSIMIVGTEDGTPTGTQHTIRVDEGGRTWVRRYGHDILFQLMSNSKFLELANFDRVVPTFVGDTATLQYFESGNLIREAILVFASETNWSVELKSYVLQENGDKILLEDSTEMSLE